jgi:hypothetical protein
MNKAGPLPVMADQQVPIHTARLLAVTAAKGPYNMQPGCRRLVAAYSRCRTKNKNISLRLSHG